MGMNNFSKAGITRLKEFEGTYYGEPCDAENTGIDGLLQAEHLLSLSNLFPDAAYFKITLTKILQEVFNISPSAYPFVILIK
jgi:hypothetical protein